MKSEEHSFDTLGMSESEMQRLGYRVVDLVIDYIRARHEKPAIKADSPASLWQQLGGQIPLDPGDPDAALAQLVAVAMENQQHGDHPRYFARVPGPSSFAAVLGEWLATGFNTMAASWGGGSGPTTVELVVIEWFRELLGLPVGTEGVLSSGGSMANLIAFGAAREAIGPGIVYMTDQAHSSLSRGLKEMGFAKELLRVIKSDANYRMPIDALREAVNADKKQNLKPMMVVATAGTTNTGVIDPLDEIASICQENRMWFHVDGAYGAPAAMCESERVKFKGLERADSLAVDPHKWLFQPYDVGCTLVTRRGALERAYTMTPEYLRDVQGSSDDIHGQEVDMRNRSLELSRRSRAIKIWMTMRTHGMNRIKTAISRGIELAEIAEKYILANSSVWELVTPAQLGVVTFAARTGGKIEHEAAVKRLADDGFAAVSTTSLHSRSVLRLCTINPLTTEEDIRETIDRLGNR